MPENPKLQNCGKCGAALSLYAPDGLCAACLLESAFEPGDARVDVQSKPTPLLSFSDYELLEEIARGGMGVVYRARQISLNRIVAIKMILGGHLANAAETQRFRAEAETAGHLQHPNIVAIHEVGEHAGQPYFSMDLVEGRNLAQLVRNEPLPSRKAAGYLKTIAEAVQYAHSRGVLHRDLKPSNILIDDSDQPRITDFGLAKRFNSGSELSTNDPHLTQTGQVLGSPSFIPPEQAGGGKDAISPAIDVYSLGAILYHCLTARPPFVAETMTATLRMVAENEPVSPRLLNASVPSDLETICLKCLEKEPQRRYASAQELADELARFLRGEPILARPLSQAERLWRWCRLNPRLAGASALVVLLLLTVAIGSTVAVSHLKTANREGQEKLRHSLISQARAGRWSSRVGRRFDGLEALKKAAEIRPSVELRNEAIACLALVDMRTVREFNASFEPPLIFNRQCDRYFRLGPDGHLRLRRVSDDTELAGFSITDLPIRGCCLSPRDRYLFTHHYNDSNSLFHVYDTERREPILSMPHWFRGLAFSSDEQRLFLCETTRSGKTGKVIAYWLTTGRTQELFRISVLPSCLAVNPAGDRLAFSSAQTREVQIRDAGNGELLFSLFHSNGVHSLNWHPEGRLLAAGCADRNIYLWDLQTQRARVFSGHDSEVVNANFSHDGNLLASAAWDDTFRLWNVWNGREILRRPCVGLSHFSDDRWIALQNALGVELCEMAGGHEWRAFYPSQSRRPEGGQCGWDPNGRLVVSAHRDGVRFWDPIKGREIGIVETDADDSFAALFDPTGTNVLAATGRGLRSWPVTWQSTETERRLVLGTTRKFGPEASAESLVLNQQGNILAASVGGAVEIFEWPSCRPLRTLRIEGGAYRCTLSSSGRFCAAWPYAGKPITVWDAHTGEQLKVFELPAYGVAFTPDDGLLITGTKDEYAAWNTQNWSQVWTFPRQNAGMAKGRIALSRDGAIGALTLSAQVICLFDPATGEEFATLEAPEPQSVWWLAFSPDASQLLANTQAGILHLWDLRLIRSQLKALKLDWDAPPFPPPALNQTTGPISISLPDPAMIKSQAKRP